MVYIMLCAREIAKLWLRITAKGVLLCDIIKKKKKIINKTGIYAARMNER